MSVTETDPLAITRASLSTALLLVAHLRHHDRVSVDGATESLRAALEPLGGVVAVAFELPAARCLSIARFAIGCLATATDSLLRVKPASVPGILADSHHALREAVGHFRSILACVEADDEGEPATTEAQA